MKFLCFGLLFAGTLLAQPVPFVYINADDVASSENQFDVVSALATKSSRLVNRRAFANISGVLAFTGLHLTPLDKPARRDGSIATVGTITTTGTLDLPFSPVGTTIAPFGASGLAPAQAAQMIFLDGLGNTIVAIDLTKLSVVSQVVVPSTSGPFGIRPVTTGSANEVWVANAATAVTVVNLGTQSVVTNVQTPSIAQFAEPVGIVFTPDGTIALEAFEFSSPDSSGNNGALLVFDAVNRKVMSTLPLKIGPVALLMAPNGQTAYLLGGSGQLTYYDVLSNTADLTVSTYAPGLNTGYPGFGGPAFIHPNGAQLYWNVGVFLTSYNLNTGQTAQFTSGLPTTVGRTFTLSQDGNRAYFSDALGDVVVMNTQSGAILLSYNTGSSTLTFGGPAIPR